MIASVERKRENISLKKLKNYGPAAAAIISAVFSGLLAFLKLFEMPLSLRLILIGVFGVVMVTLVVLVLTPGPCQGWRIVVILLSCALAVFFMEITLTYHIIQLTQSMRTDAGTIELRAGHFPANVTLTLSTPQPDVQILDWRPKNCEADGDPVEPPNIQDESPFGITIHLYNFRSSQRFCIFYRLSGKPERLTINTQAENVDVMRNAQVQKYQNRICIYFGGLLCIFSVVLFSYRCS